MPQKAVHCPNFFLFFYIERHDSPFATTHFPYLSFFHFYKRLSYVTMINVWVFALFSLQTQQNAGKVLFGFIKLLETKTQLTKFVLLHWQVSARWFKVIKIVCLSYLNKKCWVNTGRCFQMCEVIKLFLFVGWSCPKFETSGERQPSTEGGPAAQGVLYAGECNERRWHWRG